MRTQEFLCSGCKCVISDLGGCVFVLQMFFKVANRADRAASGSSSDLRSRTDNVSSLTPRKGSLSILLHKAVAFGTWKCAKDVGGKQIRCMYGKSKHSCSMLTFWLRLDSSWGDSVRFANLSTSSDTQPRSWIGVFSLPQHWSTFSRGQITMVTCFCCFQRKLCSK